MKLIYTKKTHALVLSKLKKIPVILKQVFPPELLIITQAVNVPEFTQNPEFRTF